MIDDDDLAEYRETWRKACDFRDQAEEVLKTDENLELFLKNRLQGATEMVILSCTKRAEVKYEAEIERLESARAELEQALSSEEGQFSDIMDMVKTFERWFSSPAGSDSDYGYHTDTDAEYEHASERSEDSDNDPSSSNNHWTDEEDDRNSGSDSDNRSPSPPPDDMYPSDINSYIEMELTITLSLVEEHQKALHQLKRLLQEDKEVDSWWKEAVERSSTGAEQDILALALGQVRQGSLHPTQPGCLRIGTYNLDHFQGAKAEFQISQTFLCSLADILKLDVFVFTEYMMPSDVLAASLLQYPPLRSVITASIGRGHQGFEYGYALYNSSRLALRNSGILKLPNTNVSRHPFWMRFDVLHEHRSLTIVGFHIKAVATAGSNKEEETVREIGLITNFLQMIPGSEHSPHDIIVLGDFQLAPKRDCFFSLAQQFHATILQPTMTTTHLIADHIWVPLAWARFSQAVVLEKEKTMALRLFGKPTAFSNHLPVYATIQYAKQSAP